MKASDSIIMIGAPDSGKTNYLGRLWRAMTSENASLRATQQSDDVRYVLDALTHILQGTFAPRTDTNVDVDGRYCSIQVAWEREGTTRQAVLLIPDVSGELWADAVQTNELPETWMASVRQSIGALLFVRIDSELHIPSLDWVTARERLEVGGEDAESQIPTDVQLCEFLRFLELFLGKDAGVGKPRIGVLVAAWDILDEQRSLQGPKAYLHHEFPLFLAVLQTFRASRSRFLALAWLAEISATEHSGTGSSPDRSMNLDSWSPNRGQCRLART